jgi:hypothetical protein
MIQEEAVPLLSLIFCCDRKQHRGAHCISALPSQENSNLFIFCGKMKRRLHDTNYCAAVRAGVQEGGVPMINGDHKAQLVRVRDNLGRHSLPV